MTCVRGFDNSARWDNSVPLRYTQHGDVGEEEAEDKGGDDDDDDDDDDAELVSVLPLFSMQAMSQSELVLAVFERVVTVEKLCCRLLLDMMEKWYFLLVLV